MAEKAQELDEADGSGKSPVKKWAVTLFLRCSVAGPPLRRSPGEHQPRAVKTHSGKDFCSGQRHSARMALEDEGV